MNWQTVALLLVFSLFCPFANSAQQAQATDLAIRTLEGMQRSLYAQRGLEPPAKQRQQVDDAFIESMLESLGDAVSEEDKQQLKENFANDVLNIETPSRYEDPGDYYIISSLAKRIEAVIANSDRSLSAQPLIGTLPTSFVNARIFKIPNTDRVLIVFDDQLFNFALLYSKAIASVFPLITEDAPEGRQGISTHPQEIAQHIASDPKVTQRYREVLFAYVIGGTPAGAPPYFIEGERAHLSSILRDSLELFVLGHEYGHLLQGHLNDAQLFHSAIGAEATVEVLKSWQQEIEADLVGTQLALYAQNVAGYDNAVSFAGIALFFAALDTVNRTIQVLNSGASELVIDEQASHPHALVRMEALHRALGTLYPEDAESMQSLSATVMNAVNILWERLEPEIVELHQRGIRPHPKWQQLKPAPRVTEERED